MILLCEPVRLPAMERIPGFNRFLLRYPLQKTGQTFPAGCLAHNLEVGGNSRSTKACLIAL